MRVAPQCDTGFSACEPAQPQEGKPVSRFALPSNSQRSTSSAPVMRTNVSMVGIRSRFSTRETIVSPKTAEVARESRKFPRMGRTSSSSRRTAFSRAVFSHPPHFIRVHSRNSRKKMLRTEKTTGNPCVASIPRTIAIAFICMPHLISIATGRLE